MNTQELVKAFVTAVLQDSAGGISLAPWIDLLEEKIGVRLPPSFSELVRHYRFPPFEAGEIEFFGNSGQDDEGDLTVAIFQDPVLCRASLDSGFVQFGRPSDGWYDPICFNTRKKAHNREYEITRLDHEALLMHQRVVVKKVIAPSFRNFVQRHITATANRVQPAHRRAHERDR